MQFQLTFSALCKWVLQCEMAKLVERGIERGLFSRDGYRTEPRTEPNPSHKNPARTSLDNFWVVSGTIPRMPDSTWKWQKHAGAFPKSLLSIVGAVGKGTIPMHFCMVLGAAPSVPALQKSDRSTLGTFLHHFKVTWMYWEWHLMWSRCDAMHRGAGNT